MHSNYSLISCKTNYQGAVMFCSVCKGYLHVSLSVALLPGYAIMSAYEMYSRQLL